MTMTDDELEDLTRRCAQGDPTAEAAYDKLTRDAIRKRKCEFLGCDALAVWQAHLLWGKPGRTIRTCDRHKPGANVARLKADQENDRQWYRVEPIADGETINFSEDW